MKPVILLLVPVLASAFPAIAPASPKGVCQVQPFNLTEVRLLDGPFRDAMLRDKQYLLDLEADRLLHMFRVTAGLPSSAEPYGGWEAPAGELRGHSLGHYLSACSLMFASTGDAQLKERVDDMVAELAKCQEAMPKQGYNQGFLSAYPESFFDRVDACKPVWAPYYTLHKILAGLLDAHDHCGNQQALEVVVKAAGWLRLRIARLSREQQQKALNNEHGGINEAFANLYAITGNPEHLELAMAFNHEIIFEPLARGEDRLDGLHANTQVPKIIGAAREYELTGEKRFHDVAKFFWERVALHRSYCIGGHSDREHFHPMEESSKHLSPATAETCNTYNMLKLTRHIFAWEPSAQAMDFYERALFNHILASQDPKTGMPFYFASLKPGHFKCYSTPTDSFWCCTGTGMENHARYGDAIYFHGDDSLYVNLFMASELTWKEKGVVLRQETAFPESDTMRLALKCAEPVELSLKIRRPAWASAFTVLVNGKVAETPPHAGAYVEIRRTWKTGDTVEVRMPMALRTEALPDDPKVVAVLYGPIVLAGELGTAGLENISPYVNKQLDLERHPIPEIPTLVCEPDKLLAHIEPVPGQSLTFRTKGIGRPDDVTLIPYYRLHHQRLAIYWPAVGEKEWQKGMAEKAAEEARRIEPVRLQTIHLGGFWNQQAKRLTEKWLPHCIRQMEKGGRGQEFLNLVALARVQRGEPADWTYTGAPWSDAYVYNTLEAVCLALSIDADGDEELAGAQSQLRAKLEQWIPTILAAQAPDGYIHSFHVLNQHPRYSNVGWHEFYVMGYFLEMGVAHYRMSGGKDRRLYDAAVRCGDHLCATFGPAPKRTWRNGHAGLEYALCRLGRLVNEVDGVAKGDKYIQLARHFLDRQHEGDKGNEYNQSDKPAVEMSEAKGHAVRATYFYTAMADIALHHRDAAYQQAASRIWANAIHKKHYLTGGVGASHKGEAFAGDYELPNDGYCESCAGCGLTFWADRMHRMQADGHYRDVQERALYNNILGAVELSGTNFYYQNPLDADRTRYPWHACPCCVGNIPRALLMIKDLMYSVNPAKTELYLSHYVDSEAELPDVGGAALRIRQATRYPWDGEVTVTLHPTRTSSFILKLRIPDRTESELYTATPDLNGRFSVRVNGEPQAPKLERGYIALARDWKDGDRIELSLPMEIQRVKADPKIAANIGRVALQYGPLVYNVESIDLPQGKECGSLALAADASLRAEFDERLLGGVLAIRGAFADGTPLQAIPNYARLNRVPESKGEWMHLANTYDGTTQRVFVNGRLAKAREPGPLQIADTPLIIGSDPFGQNRHFKGDIAKPAIFDTALDLQSIAQLAAAKPDTAALGVAAEPVFAGGHYALEGSGPAVTPQAIGIAGNAPWTMSVWIRPAADSWSSDSFGMGVLGWGKPGRNAGNFLYYRPQGEAVFGFYSNDDRAPAAKTAAGRSIVWLREK